MAQVLLSPDDALYILALLLGVGTTFGAALLSLVFGLFGRTRRLARELAVVSAGASALVLLAVVAGAAVDKVELTIEGEGAWRHVAMVLSLLALPLIALRSSCRKDPAKTKAIGNEQPNPGTTERVSDRRPRCVACEEPIEVGAKYCQKCGWTQPSTEVIGGSH